MASAEQLIPVDQIPGFWREYERCQYNNTNTGEALGTSEATVRRWAKRAQELGYKKVDLSGSRTKILDNPLPRKGKVSRYLLTVAQNNTLADPKCLAALETFAKHNKGTAIKVSTATYVKRQEGSEKRTAKKDRQSEIWYDPQIEHYISDQLERLAPGLVWNGHLNIIPTATNPLTGFESFNGRDSGIFPHPKVALQSIPTMRGDATKFNYTTGSITPPNYIARTAGQRAEFHHVLGALLVEVNSEGQWWCRQLNLDNRGRIYDLDKCYHADGTVETVDGIAGLVCGDVHVENIDPVVSDVTWGPGGIVDTLKPKTQILHDILDFESRSHHTKKDPHARYKLHLEGKESVFAELNGVMVFLKDFATRPWMKTAIINSNHDRHLDRWLKETDWRDDLVNAEFYIDANKAMLQAIRSKKEFDALDWAITQYLQFKDKTITFVPLDASYIICRDAHGGIECGLHGDLGANGARGSARNLSRLGRKACIGHSHAAAIVDGVYQAGTSSKLFLGYNTGPSNWSHSHILIYPNGKRQIITIWKGRWRA